MINNLGGTSVLEMSIIAKEAIQQLGKDQCDEKSETFQCFQIYIQYIQNFISLSKFICKVNKLIIQCNIV